MDNRGKRNCEENEDDDDSKIDIDLTLKLGPSNQTPSRELEDDAASGEQYRPVFAHNMGNWNGEYGRLPPAEAIYGGSGNFLVCNPMAHHPSNNMGIAPNRKKVVDDGKLCRVCGITSTPLWRKGPHGPQTLCNACGLRYLRALKKDGDQ